MKKLAYQGLKALATIVRPPGELHQGSSGDSTFRSFAISLLAYPTSLESQATMRRWSQTCVAATVVKLAGLETCATAPSPFYFLRTNVSRISSTWSSVNGSGRRKSFRRTGGQSCSTSI